MISLLKCCIAVSCLWNQVSSYQLTDSTLGLNEILWSSEGSKIYLGSPSIVRTSGGVLLASYDHFSGGPSPECWHPGTSWDLGLGDPDDNCTSCGSFIMKSEDNGLNWAYVTHVKDHYWSNLFDFGDDVLLMGTSKSKGQVRLSKSTDAGQTWTSATLFPESGLEMLLVDLNFPCLITETKKTDRYGTGPTPTLFSSDGRVYRAMEANYKWAQMLWAENTSDLMDPSSWKRSNALPFDSRWWSHGDASYIEGNAVESPDGSVYNILRLNAFPLYNQGCILKFNRTSSKLEFYRIIDMPGGSCKFTIRRDPVSKMYITLSNNVTDSSCPSMRSVLSLAYSEDLITWKPTVRLLEDDSGMQWNDVMRYVGFQYVDWIFSQDLNDILYVVRTAYRGACSYHNSNRLTFKIIKNFRQFLNMK